MNFSNISTKPDSIQDLNRLKEICPQLSNLSMTFGRDHTGNPDPLNAFSVGVCVEIFKNLNYIQFYNSEFVRGTSVYSGLKNFKYVENKVKKLVLRSWTLHKGNLEELVKIFPCTEELNMDNCVDLSFRYQPSSVLKQFSPKFEDLLAYLEIISKWKDLKTLRLISTYYSGIYTPEAFNERLELVLEFIDKNFSKEVDIELTISRRKSMETLIAVIIKKSGSIVTLMPPRICASNTDFEEYDSNLEKRMGELRNEIQNLPHTIENELKEEFKIYC